MAKKNNNPSLVADMKNLIKRSRLRKKRYMVPVIIIVVLLLFRLLLPLIIKNYVNNVLADIPGYYGHVNNIDIALIRGAYVINGLYLNKVDAGSEVPFLNFERTDISVEWSTLFKGKIVSEIVMIRPEPNIDDWTKALTDLVPIDVNRLKISNGKADFVQLSADPNIDLNFRNIDLEATNLRNVVRNEEKLPSTVHASAISIGNGTVKLDGKMDLVKQIPDMDLSFSLENAQVTSLNDFTNYYAGIDFSEGNFNLFSEIAIADGFLTGYIKPLLKDSKLLQKDDKFLEKLWEGFVGFFKFVLKNQKNNTMATKVPIEGDLNQVKGKVLPTVFNIFKNAWFSAYKGVVDNDVDFKDAKMGNHKKKRH